MHVHFFVNMSTSLTTLQFLMKEGVLFNDAPNTFYLRLYGRERYVLFNDALNTFYLRLYGVRHMVKDNSNSKRGNPLPLHGLLFPSSSKGSFICIIPHLSIYHRITHTTAFVTPVVSISTECFDTVGLQHNY